MKKAEVQLAYLRHSREQHTIKSFQNYLNLRMRRKIGLEFNDMKKSKYSLPRYKDERIVELVRKTDYKTLAIWAIDCAERVLPYFEGEYPEDHRPRNAIETLQTRI